jgi:hypothetical protein
MSMFDFWARESPKREPVFKALRPCVCGNEKFVHAGLVPWHVACGKCGALYQIEGVSSPIAARVYE